MRLQFFSVVSVYYFIALPVSANTVYEFRVTAKNLNVRDAPSSSGSVITSLPEGENVIGSNYRNGWAMIVLGEGRYGYASTQFLKAVRVFAARDEDECFDPYGSVSIDIEATSIDCTERNVGGYDYCTISIEVGGRSSCEETLNVFLYCEAYYKEKETGKYSTGFSQTKFSNTVFDFYISNGFGIGYGEISWNPGNITTDVIGVKVEDVNFQVNGIYK